MLTLGQVEREREGGEQKTVAGREGGRRRRRRREEGWLRQGPRFLLTSFIVSS